MGSNEKYKYGFKIELAKYEEEPGVTKVAIPEGITEIGRDAFKDCKNLTLHAPAGSFAEQYAKENRIPFTAI